MRRNRNCCPKPEVAARLPEFRTVDYSVLGRALVGATDIHNAIAPLNFTTISTSLTGWTQNNNILSYNASTLTEPLTFVEISLSITATDQGASSYWAKPRLLITEINSGEEWQAGELAMQDNGAYDGSVSFTGSFLHITDVDNITPSYSFNWFDQDNRTATLIPESLSTVTMRAVHAISVTTN